MLQYYPLRARGPVSLGTPQWPQPLAAWPQRLCRACQGVEWSLSGGVATINTLEQDLPPSTQQARRVDVHHVDEHERAPSTATRLRSQQWFDNPDNAAMTAIYLERYMNWGLTRDEPQSGKPVIGIAQTGSDLSPCNRHHLELAARVREGIREAGGIAFEFPVHPHPGDWEAADRHPRQEPGLPGFGRSALRLPLGRRGPDHRLRQDDARLHHGRRNSGHSRH
jgi:Dehydratase family